MIELILDGRTLITYSAVPVDVRGVEESINLLLGEVEASTGQSLGQLRSRFSNNNGDFAVTTNLSIDPSLLMSNFLKAF